MTLPPAEATRIHARILKCALELDECRAYWSRVDDTTPVTVRRAFEEYWFGARSTARVEVLLVNMRARFDAYPHALSVLRQWPGMSPDTRRLICHWHLMLADPLYRAFTGEFLPARLESGVDTVTRDVVVAWIGGQIGDAWTMATRIQGASKMLSAALTAGVVGTSRDPRPLKVPRVPDEALEYLLYMLRSVQFAGSLDANPYTASVGLTGSFLADRLRTLGSIDYRRQGNLAEWNWHFPDLGAWAAAHPAINEPGGRNNP